MRRRLLRLFVIFIIAVAFATAGVSQTPDIASLRARAEAGDANAQYEVGAKYYKGDVFPQDYSQAARWFRKAAEQGHPTSQFNLGYLYEHGEGVAQDYVQAVHWYWKAADQGFAPAQSNLAGRYEHGQGVAQDYVQAHLWFNLAGANGVADGVKSRDLIAKLNKHRRSPGFAGVAVEV